MKQHDYGIKFITKSAFGGGQDEWMGKTHALSYYPV